MKRIIPVSILTVLLYFIFFIHLGKQPIRIWDESRLAWNAYEMSQNGNLIVTYFQGKPEMWNLKPPFLIWCQAGLMNILDSKELALRIPPATFGFLTAMLLFVFCWRYLNKFWMGFFAALILATTRGYVDEHGARHGEYDVVYIFFIVLYALMFLLYFQHRKPKYLYIAMAGVTLAVLTKGIAGLFLAPVIFASAFFFRPVKSIFTGKHLYISTGMFVFFTGGYYLLREHYNPGYLKLIMDNEIFGRYNSPIEGNTGPFWMYFNRTKDFFMQYWLLLIPCGFAAGVLSKESWIRKVILFAAANSIFLFFLLSSAKTKLDWYIYPVFPFLALITSYFIWLMFDLLSELDLNKYLRYNILPYLFVFILFIEPYRMMLGRTYLSPEYDWNKRYYAIGYYLQDLNSGKEKLTEPLKIFFSDYKTNLDFYVNLLVKNNVPIKTTELKDILSGDLVICSLENDEKTLKENFNLEKLRDEHDYVVYRIKEKL